MARIGRSFPVHPLIRPAVAVTATWKTSVGLAASSVKTVNELVRASIKTYNGLTPP